VPDPCCIDVAYSGVHQAYQLALAANEIGFLRRFDCALYNAPGKWGGSLSRLLGQDQLHSRKVAGLDASRVHEHPWPLVRQALEKLFHRSREGHAVFASFDHLVSRHITSSPPNLLVTTERCALASLRAAKSQGVKTLHDCPQLHPTLLAKLLHQASDACGVTWTGFPDGTRMVERKLAEYELADQLLIYSDIHQQSFTRAGVAPERLFQCPLWVDATFWKAPATSARSPNHPLRLLFVGEFSIRKGLPFLFQALRQLDAPVSLTLIGQPTVEFPIPEKIGRCTILSLGAQTKAQLRDQYAAHDLLVLPSVADSFGFVALEAMACGLPVLLTANCGAPVPDPSWRVPAMDPAALANALTRYLDDPSRLIAHAAQALPFAIQFTPQRYRNQIQYLYRQTLGKPPHVP